MNGKKWTPPPRVDLVQFEADEYVSSCIQCYTSDSHAAWDIRYLMIEASGNSTGSYYEVYSYLAMTEASDVSGDGAPYGNEFYKKFFELTSSRKYTYDQIIPVNDSLPSNWAGNVACNQYFKPEDKDTYQGWYYAGEDDIGSQTSWHRALIWFDSSTSSIHATSEVDSNWNYTGDTSSAKS